VLSGKTQQEGMLRETPTFKRIEEEEGVQLGVRLLADG
jgi:hypothetical protein